WTAAPSWAAMLRPASTPGPRASAPTFRWTASRRRSASSTPSPRVARSRCRSSRPSGHSGSACWWTGSACRGWSTARRSDRRAERGSAERRREAVLVTARRRPAHAAPPCASCERAVTGRSIARAGRPSSGRLAVSGPAHRRPAQRAGEVAGLADGPDLHGHAVRQVGALLGNRGGLVQTRGLEEEIAADDLLGLGERAVGGALPGDDAALGLQRVAAPELALRHQLVAPGVPAREGLHAFLAGERLVAFRRGLAEDEEVGGGLGCHGHALRGGVLTSPAPPVWWGTLRHPTRGRARRGGIV